MLAARSDRAIVAALKTRAGGRGTIVHSDPPHPTVKQGGNKDEHVQTSARHEASVPEGHGPYACCRRYRADAVRAVLVEGARRRQVTVDRAMGPLRARIRHVVRQIRQGLGREEQGCGHGRPYSGAERSRTRGRRSVSRIGTRSFRLQRLRRSASLPQIFYRRCRSREGNREKVRQGHHHRHAARLQRGRRHLVCLPRFLHQLPGHVSEEPVGRDRDEARYMGQPAHRRRQAEGKRPSCRHLARAQQRPEHDLARPVVVLWRVRAGRGRQENHPQQQGGGRGDQVRRRALQGSDDGRRAVVERRQQQPVHRLRRRLLHRQPDLGLPDGADAQQETGRRHLSSSSRRRAR